MGTVSNVAGAGRFSMFRALRHRNYRLFFIGQGISLVGTWMQSIATSWLAFRLTGSELMLGVVAFSGQILTFLLSPVAGVMGDRFVRRHILIAAQALSMAQALVLAAITMTGYVRVWHIIALNLFLGLINAFEMPTRQAFVIEMLEDRSDLGNAIALNSGTFNGSRLIGPSIAGIIVALAGEGVCFLVNGLSYIASVLVLIMMNMPVREIAARPRRIAVEIREGFKYVVGFHPIRDLILIVSMLSMVAMSFPVLFPFFASGVLHGGSRTYGFLVSANGLGALAGTIYLAMRRNVLGLGRVIKNALIMFGSGLVLFSFSQNLYLSLAILSVVGFGMISVMASCNTIVQTIVDEDKRGRVMSLYVMAFMGAAPLGSFLAGSVSSAIGAPLTLRIGGLLCVLAGAAFARRLPSLRNIIRPIYRRMGIITEVAVGMQAADEPASPPEYRDDRR